ncbi:MAG: alpha/beta hydrolase [Gemmatimonadota bacterium]
MRPAVLLILLATLAAPAGGQTARDSVIRSSGTGAEAWVLLSGLVGGVAGMRALEGALRAPHRRIITIDPYRLSVDSTDVSFAAVARRVDVLLAGEGVARANVVGHAHGAGVALRLAAQAPDRVAALYFLDAGALAVSRTKVLGLALRLAPIIASLPGGAGFLRGKLLRGIRENCGRSEWFDTAAQQAYVGPTLSDVSRAVGLAQRLGTAREPETLDAVITRVRVPVVVITGSVPHPSGPGPEEFSALENAGARLRVERLAGVGHFPHEEATLQVRDILLSRSASR